MILTGRSFVKWHPERLQRNLISAVGPAASDFRLLAAAASPSRRVAASMFVRNFGLKAQVGSNHPLFRIIHGGARPHSIGSEGQPLAIGGNVVMGPVQHPGTSGNPFLRMLLPMWAMLYRRRAKAATRV